MGGIKGCTPFFEESRSEQHPGIPRPEEINLSDGLSGTFGKCETETAAENLVRFYQAQGFWKPFTLIEIIDFYRTRFPKNDSAVNQLFSGLVGAWEDNGGFFGCIRTSPDYLVLGADGNYYPTVEFTSRLKRHVTTKDQVLA
ncbi:MAG: hypothetical protein Q7S84_02940 [bacterium]|nr:hypothetical protein [bacterium]